MLRNARRILPSSIREVPDIMSSSGYIELFLKDASEKVNDQSTNSRSRQSRAVLDISFSPHSYAFILSLYFEKVCWNMACVQAIHRV